MPDRHAIENITSRLMVGYLNERKKRKRASGNFVPGPRNRRYRSGKVTGHAYAVASIGGCALQRGAPLCSSFGERDLLSWRSERERQIETLSAT